MKLSKKQLQGLATGLQLGGVIMQNLDSDREGLDDQLGLACQTGGIALAQLASGESVSKKAKAADALAAIGDACKSLSEDIRSGA